MQDKKLLKTLKKLGVTEKEYWDILAKIGHQMSVDHLDRIVDDIINRPETVPEFFYDEL